MSSIFHLAWESLFMTVVNFQGNVFNYFVMIHNTFVFVVLHSFAVFAAEAPTLHAWTLGYCKLPYISGKWNEPATVELSLSEL